MILITGLGPGDLARVPGPVRDILLDESRTLFIRTVHHPAAAEIAGLRHVVFCDDLYQSSESFEAVYTAIAERVVEAAAHGPVIYAVPGGPAVGEFAVREILARAVDVEVLHTETFVDAILAEVGYDPFDRGLQILNGHDLPSPLALDKPTIVGHLDRPEVLADVVATLSRSLPEATEVEVFAGLGASDEVRWKGPIDAVDPSLAGFRTSLWIDSDPGGLVGAAWAMRRLRRECPWDREQTHESLTKYLVEEAFELIEAISSLADGDVVTYAEVEEELGDVLLQVLFQSEIAAEAGAFSIDDVGEALREKLVRRHPHVFGDVEVADAGEVKANWDAIKRSEKRGGPQGPFAGVPTGLPALHRAGKVQNRAVKALGRDNERSSDLPALVARLEDSRPEDAPARIGDALFALVDTARRLGVDPEIELDRAVSRFVVAHDAPRSPEPEHG